MKMPDRNHPFWGIVRATIVVVGLVVILWRNAQHFDESELRIILEFFGLYILTTRKAVEVSEKAVKTTASASNKMIKQTASVFSGKKS